MWCRWVEGDSSALADGQLPQWRASWVRRHLRSCPDCARRQAAVERSVAAERDLLPLLLRPAEVPADDMWLALRRKIAAEPEVETARSFRPRFVLASAVGVAVVFLALRVLNPVWIALGIERPPEQVSESPELFLDYELFEHLPVIENLDRVSDVETRSQQG